MFSDYSALFLDRDGTLIEDCGYLSDPSKVQLLPDVRSSLAKLQKKKWLFFLFSNQSGVGRGLFTMEEVDLCNRRMVELLGLGDKLFSRVCCAIGTPDNPCEYRKPSPKFILECLNDFNLDPRKCWMVGDRVSDVEAGCAAGINSIFLTTRGIADVNSLCCCNFKEVFKVLSNK